MFLLHATNSNCNIPFICLHYFFVAAENSFIFTKSSQRKNFKKKGGNQILLELYYSNASILWK